MNATDGTDAGLPNSTTITISNTAPVMTSVDYNPNANIYKTTAQLDCDAIASDVDGDSLIYSYLHYKDDTTTGITTEIITNASYDKGNVLICEAFATDLTDNSNLMNSTPVIVLNTVPVAEELTINPFPNAYPTSIITCAGTSVDADLDVLTDLYQFRNDTETLQAYSTTDTYNCDGINCNYGAIIYCDYKSNDGSIYSNILTNSTIINLNTAPEIIDIAIIPAIAYSLDTLNCSAIYSDAEANVGDVSIDWYNGTTKIYTNTETNVNSGNLVSFTNIYPIHKGETWNCTMNATDRINAGATNSTIRTISNSVPVITSISLTPLTISTIDIANCSATATDLDGDLTGINISVYTNGTFLKSVLKNSSIVSTTIPTQISQTNITCKAFATDYTDTSSELIISKVVTNPQVILVTPSDNARLNYPVIYQIKANTNWVAQNCTFYYKTSSGSWTKIGTSATAGYNFTYNWNLPCLNLNFDTEAVCDGIQSNANHNILIDTKRICCPQNDNGICSFTEGAGAGTGMVIQNLSYTLPQFIIIIELVALIVGICAGIGWMIKKKLQG
jgi:hypothetical protein